MDAETHGQLRVRHDPSRLPLQQHDERLEGELGRLAKEIVMRLSGDVAPVDPADLIGPDEVADIIGLTNRRGVSVYRKRPGFPAPVIDRARCVLWLRADIEAWGASRTT